MTTKIFSGECQCSNNVYLEHAKDLAMRRALGKFLDFAELLKQKKMKLKKVGTPKTSCIIAGGKVVYTLIVNIG